MRPTTILVSLILAESVASAEDPCARERQAYSRDSTYAARVKGTTAAGNQRAIDEKAEIAKQKLLDCEARAEAQQAQDEAAKKERDAEEVALDKIRRNAKAMSMIYGAGFCLIAEDRAAALKEIATQRKYSRIGGVVNLRSLSALQDTVRRLDELEAADRKTLREDFPKLKPLACTDAAVKALVFCKRNAGTDGCADREMALAVSLVTDPDAERE